MIYFASPYSGTPAQMEARYTHAREYVLAGIRAGFHVFSPIVTWHPHAEHGRLPTDADFWWNYNRNMLDRSDFAMFFLGDGYEQSQGVAQEYAYASNQKIPIVQLWPENGTPEQAWALVASEYRKLIGVRVPKLRRN